MADVCFPDYKHRCWNDSGNAAVSFDSSLKAADVPWLDQQQPDALKRWIRDTKVPVLASQPNGTINWCNAAFENLLGYPLPELAGMSWTDITVSGSDVKTDIQLAKETERGDREEYQFQKEYLRKDKSTVSVRIHVLRYPEQGEFESFLVTVIPLDGYDKIQLEMLMTMERQLCALVETASSSSRAIEAFAKRKDSMQVVYEWGMTHPYKATAIVLVIASLLLGDRFKDAALFARDLIAGRSEVAQEAPAE